MPGPFKKRSLPAIIKAPIAASREPSGTPNRDVPRLSRRRSSPRPWLVIAVLAISIGAVYGRALNAPFIFDDRLTIISNRSISSLWPLIGVERPGPLNPPNGLPTSARPLVNLSFAVNYYLGGLNTIGYHGGNVALHFLSSLLVWAIVRRTLHLSFFRGRFETSAGWLALTVSMIWALHPLATEAVIYATQRTELMAAFFYLATLYCSLRYWAALPLPPGEGRGEGALDETPNKCRRLTWLTLAVFACLAGMASKQVMASAPLVVLLFERTFVAGSLANALRRSWPLYAGLASTWLLLWFLSRGAPYGTSAGFGLGVSAFDWWITQTKVLLMYLKLAVWPWPLLIHYQFPYFTTFAAAWMYVVPVLLLATAALILLWLNHPVGFLATALFAILSPTSIVPINTEMAAERRMYLPLVCLTVLFVVGGYWLVQTVSLRWKSGRTMNSAVSVPRAVVVLPAILLVFVYSLVSTKRLAAYDDEITLFGQVAAIQPANHLAHNNLGYALLYAGRTPEAIVALRAALALKPDYSDALNNLALCFMNTGRYSEALKVLHDALALDSDDTDALNDLGITLTKLGRAPEAIKPLMHALTIKPDFTEAHCNLGNALIQAGRLPEAIDQLRAAVALQPDYPVALNNLGFALARTGHFSQAVEHLEHALRLQPDYAAAHNTLGIALSGSGNVPQAIEQFRLALKINHDDANAHFNLGNALARNGDMAEAIAHFEQTVRLRPDSADMHYSLAEALRKTRRPQEAIEHYQTALRLKPDFMPAYANLAQAYALANQPKEAIATAEKAIEVARATGPAATVQQIDEWLNHYRTQARGAAESPTSSKSPTGPQ